MKFFNNISYKNKLMLSLFSFGLLIIFGIGTLVVLIIEKEQSEKNMITAEMLYEQKLNNLSDFIGKIERTLFAVKNSKFFVDYLHDTNEKNLKIAEEAFVDISHCSSNIMQLRFIDTDGMERIRVDRNSSDSSPYIVARDKLQNKAHRYYFSQITQTPNDLVWYSHIDLNVEHREIEKPIKPVLRVGIPYFDNNKLLGILIVNVFMKEFLDKLVSSNEYDIYVVDKDDNLLVSTDHYHNWSNYIDQNKSNGSNFYFSDLKLELPFYSNTVNFNNGEELKLVIKPRDTLLLQTFTNESRYVVLLLILVSILSLPLVHLFSKYPAKLEKEIADHNKYLMHKIDKAIDSYKKNEKMLLHQHRLAQIGEMIAMITHQWRQPLATITALISGIKIKLALEDSCSKEFLNKTLSSIEIQTINLNQIIGDFKNFYSKNTPVIETSIDAVVKSSLEIVSSQSKAKYIIIDTDLNDKSLFKLDANHLKQAIIAILQNSQEAFDAQTDKIIEVRTYAKADSHIIEISDNAGGIPEEIIENIFVAYFSTKQNKNGTGLGLYMTKMIIEKHCEGTISVHNSKDGVMFTITI